MVKFDYSNSRNILRISDTDKDGNGITSNMQVSRDVLHKILNAVQTRTQTMVNNFCVSPIENGLVRLAITDNINPHKVVSYHLDRLDILAMEKVLSATN